MYSLESLPASGGSALFHVLGLGEIKDVTTKFSTTLRVRKVLIHDSDTLNGTLTLWHTRVSWVDGGSGAQHSSSSSSSGRVPLPTFGHPPPWRVGDVVCVTHLQPGGEYQGCRQFNTHPNSACFVFKRGGEVWDIGRVQSECEALRRGMAPRFRHLIDGLQDLERSLRSESGREQVLNTVSLSWDSSMGHRDQQQQQQAAQPEIQHTFTLPPSASNNAGGGGGEGGGVGGQSASILATSDAPAFTLATPMVEGGGGGVGGGGGRVQEGEVYFEVEEVMLPGEDGGGSERGGQEELWEESNCATILFDLSGGRQAYLGTTPLGVGSGASQVEEFKFSQSAWREFLPVLCSGCGVGEGTLVMREGAGGGRIVSRCPNCPANPPIRRCYPTAWVLFTQGGYWARLSQPVLTRLLAGVEACDAFDHFVGTEGSPPCGVCREGGGGGVGGGSTCLASILSGLLKALVLPSQELGVKWHLEVKQRGLR